MVLYDIAAADTRSVLVDVLTEYSDSESDYGSDHSKSSACGSGYTSEEVENEEFQWSSDAEMASNQMKLAIYDATHLESSTVLDGIVGIVGVTRGIISFDNHATAGVGPICSYCEHDSCGSLG